MMTPATALALIEKTRTTVQFETRGTASEHPDGTPIYGAWGTFGTPVPGLFVPSSTLRGGGAGGGGEIVRGNQLIVVSDYTLYIPPTPGIDEGDRVIEVVFTDDDGNPITINVSPLDIKKISRLLIHVWILGLIEVS